MARIPGELFSTVQHRKSKSRSVACSRVCAIRNTSIDGPSHGQNRLLHHSRDVTRVLCADDAATIK
jgi:hypothetical protein